MSWEDRILKLNVNTNSFLFSLSALDLFLNVILIFFSLKNV